MGSIEYPQNIYDLPYYEKCIGCPAIEKATPKDSLVAMYNVACFTRNRREKTSQVYAVPISMASAEPMDVITVVGDDCQVMGSAES